MGFEGGNNEKQEKKIDGGPKVDLEIKNPAIAKQAYEEFSHYLEDQPERKESMAALNGEAKKLNRNFLESIEQKFEQQLTSGEILKIMSTLKDDIAQNGYETARRNNGVGLFIPVQLALREAGYGVQADGMPGPKTLAALNKFLKDNNLPETKTFQVDASAMDALINAYTKNYREVSNFKPSPEKLAELENKKYKETLWKYFIVENHLRPRIGDILPSSQDKGGLSDFVPAKQKEGFHDMIRSDGVKSIAFGPALKRSDNARLDLSSFDLTKNSTITLVAHTNNGFETTFTVDAKDITRKNDKTGAVKINPLKLYEETRKALIPTYTQQRWGGSTANAVLA